MLPKEEAEREKSVQARKAGKVKEENEEALSVAPKGGKGMKGVTCWNCGEKGHYKNKCPKPEEAADGKKDDPPKKGSANTAESDSESKGAWAMDVNSVCCVGRPNARLQSPWGSLIGGEGEVGEDDWFQEEPEEYDWFWRLLKMRMRWTTQIGIRTMTHLPLLRTLPAYPRNPLWQ